MKGGISLAVLTNLMQAETSLAERLKTLSLCKKTQDISKSRIFFEKDILPTTGFEYMQYMFIPTANQGSGFRRLPHMANDVKDYFEESFLMQICYTRAFDILNSAEIPTLKPTGEKIKINVIRLERKLLDGEIERQLSDDTGEDYEQSLWQKALTILGLAVNTNIVVSNNVLLYIQENFTNDFTIHVDKEFSFYRQEIEYITDVSITNPFDYLKLNNISGVIEAVDFAYNQFHNMPKSEQQTQILFEHSDFSFYYIQSFLLHQQLRLALAKSLLSYEFIDRFLIENQSPYDGQLFNESGLNFNLYSKDLFGDQNLLNSYLTSLFWHLYEDGFLFLSDSRLKGQGKKLLFSAEFNGLAVKNRQNQQVDMFKEHEISTFGKINILLLLMLSVTEPAHIFNQVSDLISNQDYASAIKSIMRNTQPV